jgi:hypothetical protein
LSDERQPKFRLTSEPYLGGTHLIPSTRAGGQLLMANTCAGVEDYLLRPWLIRTYRDLFINVGYRLATEETFAGAKDGADIEVLISLFGKTL